MNHVRCLPGVMLNPVFRAEFNYSLTPEFPLPLFFSGI
jgi:hypothetical protein